MSNLSQLDSLIIVGIQLLAAMSIFTWRQPRRDRFYLRASSVCAVALAVAVLASWASSALTLTSASGGGVFVQFVAFAVVAVALIALIMFCYDLPMQNAALLAVASYSAQNLSDSIGGLYLVILSAVTGGTPVGSGTGWTTSIPAALTDNRLITLVSTAIVYLACWWFFARQLKGTFHIRRRDWKVVFLFFAMLFFEIVFDLTLKNVMYLDMTFYQHLVFSLTKVTLVVFLLAVEFGIFLSYHMEAEVKAMSRIVEEQGRQYELTRESMEAVNRRVHDIRHQVVRLVNDETDADRELLRDISHEFRVFDTQVKTGSDALDVVLREKSLVCERYSVTLTCIADGRALAFLTAAELYALVGSALDAAIVTAKGVADARRRSISLVASKRAGMMTLHVECYSDAPAEVWSGHWLATIRAIAERHAGTAVTGADAGTASLNVLIPLP